MRLTLSKALMLALLASLIPGGCDRTATDREEAASKGGTGSPTPAGGATGQANAGQSDTAQGSSRR
jgi:hypothetical protein